MKLREIIKHIDKSPENEDWCGYIEYPMIHSLRLGMDAVYQDSNNKRLTCYWVSKWHSTDTNCGIRAYFLDDELVCISTKNYRRDDERFQYVSTDAIAKLRNYVLSLIYNEDFDSDMSIVNMQLDMGEGYTIQYVDDIVSKTAIYNGQPVELDIKQCKQMRGSKSAPIVLNGETIIVEMSDLVFPYHCNKPVEIKLPEPVIPDDKLKKLEMVGWVPFDHTMAFMDKWVGKLDDLILAIKTKSGQISFCVFKHSNDEGFHFQTTVGNIIKLSDVDSYIIL